MNHEVKWSVRMADGTTQGGVYACADEAEVRVAIRTVNAHYAAAETSGAVSVTHSVRLDLAEPSTGDPVPADEPPPGGDWVKVG